MSNILLGGLVIYFSFGFICATEEGFSIRRAAKMPVAQDEPSPPMSLVSRICNWLFITGLWWFWLIMLLRDKSEDS